MRLKRFLVLSLVFSLVLSMNFANAKSDNTIDNDKNIKNGKVLFKAEKIVDDNLIFQRMEKGITDDKNFRANCDLSASRVTDAGK